MSAAASPGASIRKPIAAHDHANRSQLGAQQHAGVAHARTWATDSKFVGTPGFSGESQHLSADWSAARAFEVRA